MAREEIVGTDESVRQRLLETATALFAQKGYAATTVREIVVDAGVTKPALYYHFGSKEGIYLAILADSFKDFESTVVLAAAAPGTAQVRILRLCDEVLALVLEHLDVVRVVDSTYYGPPQGAPAFDIEAFHRIFQEALRAIVVDGMASGELRQGSVEDVTWAVIGAFDVARALELCHPELKFGREGLRRVLDVVFRGVLAGGEETRR
jgi:TetR/AcrR family transcriptional regulator